MGKALAAISEKMNAITERPNIPMQQLNPRTMTPNMGQYSMVNPNIGQFQNTNKNIRQYHPNMRQYPNTNPRQYQNVNPTMGQYQNTNRTLQLPLHQIQWKTPKP